MPLEKRAIDSVCWAKAGCLLYAGLCAGKRASGLGGSLVPASRWPSSSRMAHLPHWPCSGAHPPLSWLWAAEQVAPVAPSCCPPGCIRFTLRGPAHRALPHEDLPPFWACTPLSPWWHETSVMKHECACSRPAAGTGCRLRGHKALSHLC